MIQRGPYDTQGRAHVHRYTEGDSHEAIQEVAGGSLDAAATTEGPSET